jgi:hypothetical protein
MRATCVRWRQKHDATVQALKPSGKAVIDAHLLSTAKLFPAVVSIDLDEACQERPSPTLVNTARHTPYDVETAPRDDEGGQSPTQLTRVHWGRTAGDGRGGQVAVRTAPQPAPLPPARLRQSVGRRAQTTLRARGSREQGQQGADQEQEHTAAGGAVRTDALGAVAPAQTEWCVSPQSQSLSAWFTFVAASLAAWFTFVAASASARVLLRVGEIAG